MEKRLEYYCKKIDKAIKDNNKSDAEMYYKKALKNIGDSEEILAFKSSIDNIKVKTTAEEVLIKENSKIVKSNEGLVTLIAVLIAAAVLIIYCCSAIFPKYSLYRKLNHTWYVGDVSTSHSDGLALEFEFDDNYTFELSYRFWKDSNYFAISTFSGQILNGNEISLDGQTIKVDFEENGEIVAFSPSFIGLGDKSTWKMYDIGIGGNEYFEGADFASTITSSNSQNTTSNKTNSSSSEFTNSSSENEDEAETNTSSLSNATNNTGTSSKPSNSNTTSSKPSTSSTTSSTPSVPTSGTINGLSYITKKDGTIEIEEYEGSATTVNVPSEINGRAVTSIGYGAFSKCNNITNITLPNSITSIDSYAFEYCRNLTSITLSNSIISIGGGAFDTCEKLTNITIPKSIKRIGSNVFVYCYDLDVINFAGTMSQWNNIENVDNIGGYSTIHCTDGDIS